jgi:phosphoribosylformylglycinamidine synthase
MIYRIDVHPASAGSSASGHAVADPLGESIRHQIAEFGAEVGAIATSRIFLIDAGAADGVTDGRASDDIIRAASSLLADPVVETATHLKGKPDDAGKSRIEIHLKPGVMDPVAASTEMALRDMGIAVRQVRTGRAYLIDGKVDRQELGRIASRVLANGVIESVHFDAFILRKFETGREDRFELRHVALRELSDEQLVKLSREGHLFLSLPEMKAIQDYFRREDREPTDIELETLAQTWSEHCVHKTLKSSVAVEVRDETGAKIATRSYRNLIKETIFASTMELMKRSPGFCLSVFVDNAGVVAFDETDAVCFKVETHNHPSAIEPYGGSATGAGGVIRDILGTGLAAKPIANTDVFCVAYPDYGLPGARYGRRAAPLPRNVIHPRRILRQIVAGVRDYGNRMGIPTVNGAVYFDDRYLGNPLVFCGCVGLIPRDKIAKAARPGDAIVVMGGRTGRDGIHGATFSSAELTDTHADEFSHAVQIGNAITEKKVADVILQARDRNLFTAITDCGAGGLSSAVGEMASKTGARVELDKVPLKYAGLRYDEIWISEAQERMVLSVPAEHLDALLKLAAGEDVEATVIGEFGTPEQELILTYRGTEVGRMGMDFIHDGIPMPTRSAIVVEPSAAARSAAAVARANLSRSLTPAQIKDRLLSLLAHPNIASKHWVIRQYDHEVQGGSVIKPLTGPLQIGPSDAAVLRPKLGSERGVVLGCGLTPRITDPYEMSLAAIDEAIRNVVAVGADPGRVAILDNFCWPSVDDEKTMGTLVRACEACRDAALAYGIPFISGKDSLHNQFTNQETGEVLRIPSTLLISAIGVIDDVRKCVTMDLKSRTSRVVLVTPKDDATARQDITAKGNGAATQDATGVQGPTGAQDSTATQDATSPANLSALHRAMASAIGAGLVAACHDVSDGGYATAAAEMCIASGLGLIVGAELLATDAAFAESAGRYLVELRTPEDADAFRARLAPVARVIDFGIVQHLRKLTVTSGKERLIEIGIDELTSAWRGTLDW